MKNLIIVESPTKAKTLKRFLGKDFSVEATMGHIKDLPKSKLSVDVDKKFAPNYQLKEERDKEVNKIREEAKKAKKIFIATDPDREGEAIAKHVEEILADDKPKISKDKIERIVFHEITKEAVEKAISEPGKVDKNLVDAQIARRVLDRLVGYKLSPVLWKKVRRGLSAGRVQTVVVRLIVEKEKEIEAFKKQEYWEIFCDVKSKASGDGKQKSFVVKLIKIGDKKAEAGDKKTAGEVVNNLEKSEYKVLDVVKREVKKSPYPPFTTSTMTQAAARYFHWSAKKTMSVAQKLYEEGLITYHRTDSVHLAAPAVEKVRSYIQKEFGDEYLPPVARVYKTKSKAAQEAHEAIRPTDVKIIGDKFEIGGRFQKEAETLYNLIWKRFVACQMEQSVFDATRVDVMALRNTQSKLKKYLLRVSGQVMKFDGWRKVIPLSKDEEPELPRVEKDEPLDLLKVNSEQKFTQPPARFNEASLIKTLEKLGIGRPSTYAPTISTIQVRQYVEKIDRNFKPTLVGIAVNDFLIGNFSDTFQYSFTAAMEDDLDNVAHGKRKWANMMAEFYKPFEKKVIRVEEKAKRIKIPTEKLGKKCPDCKKGDLVIRIGRFGKFVSCSEFPECKHTGKYENRIGMSCPDCAKKKMKKGRRPKGPSPNSEVSRTEGLARRGQIIIKKTGKGRKFFGCSNYPECEWASWKDPREEEKKEKSSGEVKTKS